MSGQTFDRFAKILEVLEEHGGDLAVAHDGAEELPWHGLVTWGSEDGAGSPMAAAQALALGESFDHVIEQLADQIERSEG